MVNYNFCVVMPVYNEEACIAGVIHQWAEICKKHQGKLIVINDGSTDGTLFDLNNLECRYPLLTAITQKNQGHGAAIYKGYCVAMSYSPEWIFQVDSDDQFYTSDFDRIWNIRHIANVIVGVRKNRQDPAIRKWISKCMKLLNYCMFGVKIKDANCPFRLYNTKWLEENLARVPVNSFIPNIFLSILAAKQHTLISVNVYHKERETGVVTINKQLLKVITRCAKELVTWK